MSFKKNGYGYSSSLKVNRAHFFVLHTTKEPNPLFYKKKGEKRAHTQKGCHNAHTTRSKMKLVFFFENVQYVLYTKSIGKIGKYIEIKISIIVTSLFIINLTAITKLEKLGI